MKYTKHIKLIEPIIITLILLQGCLLFFYVNKSNTAKNWLFHTHVVIKELDNIHTNIHETQINDTQKLNELLLQNIKNLRLLTIDNAEQQQQLDILQKDINSYILSLTNSNTAANSFILKKITSDIHEMIQIENKLLNTRQSLDDNLENKLLILLLITVSFTYISIFFLIVVLSKSQNALKESQERLNLAVSGTSDGLWDLDPRTNTVYYSPRFKEILGYSDEELSSNVEEFNKLIHPEDLDRVWSAVAHHLEQHTPLFSVEYRARSKTGDYMWIQARGKAVWDETGKAVRMTGFNTDITHRKESALLKDEFVSTVSHELRTPLTSIRGALGLILTGSEGPLTQSIQHFLEIAYKNAERLILLINDILDIQKMEAGQMQLNIKSVNLKDIVEQSIALNQSFTEQYQVQIHIKEPFNKIWVMGDRERLIQVMINLLSNAVRYTKAGTDVEVFASQNNDFARISVVDHGKGIAKQFQSSIFNKYFQVNDLNTPQKTGTGLGLFVCKQIIEKLNGKIGFESIENQGSTFFFELPMIQPQSEITAVNTLTENKKITSSSNQTLPTILYLEDDADLIKVIARSLHDIANVISASSLREAQDILKNQWIDLILLDIVISEDSGLRLLDLLGEKNIIPIVILSAYEVSDSISKKVCATLVKSKASEGIIINIIKSELEKNKNKDEEKS